MAVSLFPAVLLLSALLTTPAPPPTIKRHPPPPPPPLSPREPKPHSPPAMSPRQPAFPPPILTDIQQDQLNNIINALIGGWAHLLLSADLPVTATFFIPNNDAVSRSMDPFLIPYHIVPQRLTFADLRRFAARSRLPTLLPSKSILITANSGSDFTIDDSSITQPDLFLNTAISVHGIQNLLNYSLYGEPNPDNSTAPVHVPVPGPRADDRPPKSKSIPDDNQLSSGTTWRRYEIILAIFTGFCAFRTTVVPT